MAAKAKAKVKPKSNRADGRRDIYNLTRRNRINQVEALTMREAHLRIADHDDPASVPDTIAILEAGISQIARLEEGMPQ